MILHCVVILLASHAAVATEERSGIARRMLTLHERKNGLSSWKDAAASDTDKVEHSPCNDEESVDIDTYLTMIYALRADDAETVKTVLDEGMDANATYVNSTIHGRPMTEGSSLLHWAAVYGATKCIPVLLNHGAEIDSVTNTSFTPLHTASQSGHLTAVKVIVSNGAAVDAQSETGNTPLHEAANRGYATIVEFLIESGANVDETNAYGFTAIEFAAQSGHPIVVEMFIANEADVNHQDAFGFGPLHMAAMKGFTTIVEMLVSAEADLEIKNDEGRTPLHDASSYGHLNISEVLVEAGADKSAETEEGRTPLDVVCENASPECIQDTETALSKLLAN